MITQLFYEQRVFLSFSGGSGSRQNIEVPVLPGLMPITSAGQVKNIVGMVGNEDPEEIAGIY